MGDADSPSSATSSRCSAAVRISPAPLRDTARCSTPIAVLPSIVAIGPDATQAIFSNRNKEFSQKGWHPVIGPFFNRGLMLLDFDEHLYPPADHA